MNKGEVIQFKDFQIGDYFSDNDGQKYRRITDRKIELPDIPNMVINAFHIQSNCMYSFDPENEFIFIRHATGDFEKNEKEFMRSTRVSEIEHQQDLFSDYSETLNSFLRENTVSTDSTDDGIYNQQEYDEFTNMIRSSFFISLYSFLETQLNNECRNVRQENSQIKISLGDINGSGINRAKIFLEKILNTSFPFNTDTNWREILFFNKLRNLLVHEEGQVKDKELLQQIESHQYLYLDDYFNETRVKLEDGFCDYVINIICGFLKSLEFYRQADRIC